MDLNQIYNSNTTIKPTTTSWLTIHKDKVIKEFNKTLLIDIGIKDNNNIVGVFIPKGKYDKASNTMIKSYIKGSIYTNTLDIMIIKEAKYSLENKNEIIGNQIVTILANNL